ncbi:MAG: NfeD family protein [Okeania sp. SIO2H7]|nr:NfeD family protein [Okeania sp. SIO2H7]
MELFVPTAFVIFMMGLSAFAVAAVSLFLPVVSLQLALWMLLSVASIFFLPRFVPKGTAATLADAKEAETLTEIPAGEAGRVLFEGNSWRAKCVDETLAIPAKQKAIVIGREGNTLFVMPEKLLRS